MNIKKNFTKVSVTALSILVAASIFSTKPLKPAHAGNSDAPKTFNQEDMLTEDNQARLLKNQPPVTVEHSLERDNLNRRLEFINDANKLGYVYILADTGQVISSYSIKGKVSSLNSYITQIEQIRCKDTARSETCHPVSSPDLDGSYGSNPDGIFFFTTDGTYVEWAGRYMYSSQALNINTPVSLSRQVQ